MLVEISKIKVSNRIRKDFGNIDELANDIKENGLINPPVVSPDMQLLAGERRLRACQQLGWKQIEVRVMTVRDAEHQLNIEINENENRKDFTFSEKLEWARRLERIERVKAEERRKATLKQYKDTDMHKCVNREVSGITNEIVAEKSGFGSREKYRKAKFIAENADQETINKLDNGEISIHKAYTELKNKLKQVEQELEKERNKPPKVETKIIEKEVDRTDYDSINKLNKQIHKLQEQLNEYENKYNILKDKLELEQQDAAEYRKMKQEIERLHREKDDLHRQIDSALELSELYVEIEHLLKNKLAPIKYSRALTERRDSEVAMNNLREIIRMVKEWCKEMEAYLPKENYIDMEVIDYE
ncbi:ParB N-terminal domain-containing protein [Bacillus smithii]|uniref:ParB N-terminal domain-containing protein n=1 Tax=Bacillus smithii TaxID=1479 RepID=UPI002E1B8B3D|nr:ParB N-terminal domain-containing protein [Bacillus smithii]MED4928972.1 ParB N-terminal domain-containing protein [Bacillus smithii]